MNEVRVLTAVLILGLAPIACTRPTATPTTDAAAESERATREYAHGALLQTPTPTTGPEVAATGRALPRDPTADEMRDGRHFGGLKAMLPGTPPMLVVDPAVMFGGDEADAASIADGKTSRMHELPNNYYIRDLDTTTVTLPISPTAVITLSLAAEDHLDMATSTVTVDDLLGWFAGTPVPPVPDRRWYEFWGDPAGAARDRDRYGYAPQCWITTLGGAVVAIEDQYRP